MAAPNLKNPTTITGKTVGYAVTTSLASALSNGVSSGKVLKVNAIYCANVDGVNSADISVSHYNGTNDFYLAKTVAVLSDSTQIILGENYIYLEEGHSIRAVASAAGDLELVISYEDIS